MELLNAIQSLLSMGGQPAQQAPATMLGINIPKPGPLAGIGNIMDSVLSANPYYRQNALGQQQLNAAKIENQNAPALNALKNALMSGQINKLNITNQLLPETLQSQNLLRQMQAQAMPQRLALQQGRLDLDRERFSPEQLQALLDWRKSNAATAPLRALTATGKGIMEQSNIESGLMPTGQSSGQSEAQGVPNNALLQALYSSSGVNQADQPSINMRQPGSNLPDTPENLSGQYGLLRQKQVTDVDTRRRNLFATNIEKTADNIDPNVIAYYSGPEGKARLAKDAALGVSKASPQYKEYISIVDRKIPLLAGQIRQFYGESIQPSMREHLEQIIDPRTWQDPEIGLQGYRDIMSLMQNEMQTYRDALRSPAVYQGKSQSSAKSQSKYSDEDIRHTAQKYGISEEEVRKRLGVS